MRFEADGPVVTLDYDGEKKEITIQDAILLQAELSAAIQEAFEEKARVLTRLLVTPEDKAWGVTLAKVEI